MNIFKEILNRQNAGQPFILATIIKTAGASPRDAGAKMLVYSDGSISDTIGGGTFEKLVIEDCLELLRGTKKHLFKKYNFTESGKEATGMTCGGQAEVFMEVHNRTKRLIIFGGGHIGQELTRLAAASDFSLTVVDNRPDIIENYDDPINTILTDPEYKENFPTFDSDCYVVIVTHSHSFDQPVLARVLKENCAYIGMIGSKAKIAKLYASLEKAGFDRSQLEKVFAPIGLHIKSEGPHEIAISILAEIIAVKNGMNPRQQ
ncbi:MAG: XdhC family protein [FCB group bacterium]|nr:XdhC family protein [FCB group bacterium]